MVTAEAVARTAAAANAHRHPTMSASCGTARSAGSVAAGTAACLMPKAVPWRSGRARRVTNRLMGRLEGAADQPGAPGRRARPRRAPSRRSAASGGSAPPAPHEEDCEGGGDRGGRRRRDHLGRRRPVGPVARLLVRNCRIGVVPLPAAPPSVATSGGQATAGPKSQRWPAAPSSAEGGGSPKHQLRHRP